MIKKYLLILFTVLSALALGACGSSSSSSGGGGGGGGLATGGFTKTFNTADDGGNTYPFHGTFDQKIQFLYTASEINGSGNITSLRFRRAADTIVDITCLNLTVRLGHTNVPVLTSTFASNVQTGKGSLVTVLNDATLVIPVGTAGEWFYIALTTPFNYNGVDNLVVEIERTTACTASQSTTTFTAATNRRAASSTVDVTAGVAEHDQANSSLPDTTQPWMQFVFAGGDNKQTMGGVGSNLSPFGFSMPRMQSLYLASEINGSGPITGLAYQMDTTSFAGSYTFSLKMGHTALSTLGLTFADNYSDTPVTVATNVTVNIPVGIPAGGWVWIPIPDGVFTYNGTDNLIVDIDKTVGTANNWVRTASIAGRRAEGSSGALVASAVDSTYYHMKFRFNGGTMDKITGTSNPEGVVFSGANSGKVQYIFRPSELGTSGPITGMACRLFNPNVADTIFTNTEVVLAHRVTDSLSTTFADNVTGGAIVRSGTYTMAAGLLTGDWVEIPFTTPFVYNGTDNLVVQIATDASAMRRCYIQNAATLYLGRRVSNADRTSATGAVSDYLLNSRFMISK